ncbi:unnamed protein product, partial [Symbiodinium necroappetens]
EILLSSGLRILHDILGLGGTALPHSRDAPPPSSSAAPPQPEPEPSSRPGPSSSSSSKAPPPGPSSSSSWYDRPGPSSSSSSKAPPPDPSSGYTWYEKGKGKGPWRQKGRHVWEDPHGKVWEEVSDMSDISEDDFESDGSWELDSDSSGSVVSVVTTNTGAKAGVLVVDGCARTGDGGAGASTDPPPTDSKKAPPPPPPSGDGGPKTKAKVSTHALKCPTCNRPRGDNSKAVVSTAFYSFGFYTGRSQTTATRCLQQYTALGVWKAMSMNMPRIGYALTARPRSAPLINHGQAAEDRFVVKGATAMPVVLNRREVVNQGSGMGLEEVVEVEEEEMGIPSQATDDVVAPTPTETTAMEVDEPEPVSAYIPPTAKSSGIPAEAYPGQTVWHSPQPSSPVMSTTSDRFLTHREILWLNQPPSRGTMDQRGQARGPMGETRPLAIVLPNGEALWFTTRDIDVDTPRLVIPWSLFQYLAMSRRSLSGFQSWGKVGVVYIRRVAQDIIHGAQQRGSIMDRIREANRTNPLLMDLQSAYPEPQDAVPPTSASTGAYRPNFNFRDFLQRPSFGEHFHPGEGPPRVGRGPLPCIYDQPAHEMPLAASVGEADHASNCMGMWARRLLGQENPSPPSKGVPPKATPSTPATEPTTPTAEPAPEEVEEDEDSDVELTAEERAEVARIEEECSELERRMRNLSVTQQRSLLENLANASSAVIGGLLADTVRRTAQMRGKGAKGSGRPKVKANQASANKDPK